jgi:hypothetical protein
MDRSSSSAQDADELRDHRVGIDALDDVKNHKLNKVVKFPIFQKEFQDENCKDSGIGVRLRKKRGR